MALTIKSKVQCNDCDYASNKSKKPPRIHVDNTRIVKRYDELGVVVLKPHIDRSVLGFFINQSMLNEYGLVCTYAELETYIKGNLFGDAKNDPASGLKTVTGKSFFKKPYCDYNVNLEYRPCTSNTPMLIQVGPKSPKNPLIKVDLNPSRYTVVEMAAFRSLIGGLFVTSGGSIAYSDLILGAMAYRTDIAVDVLGIQPPDIELRVLKGKQWLPHKRQVYLSKIGKAETIYPRAVAGKSSHEYVYDKRQELIDNQMPPVYGDVLHTRFECRVIKKTVGKLANVKNRCRRVSIQAVDYKKLHKLNNTQRLFMGLALSRSLTAALQMLPAKYHAKYSKSYQNILKNVWPADLIWEHWKEALANSGLLP